LNYGAKVCPKLLASHVRHVKFLRRN